MKKQVIHKNRAKSGFTIAELLITVAILGVVLSAVTVSVSSAMHQYKSGMRRSETDILYSTLYEALTAELRTGTGITVDEAGEVTSISSKMFNVSGPIQTVPFDSASEDGAAPSEGGIVCIGDTPIISRASYPDGVSAYIDPIKYDDNAGVLNVTLTFKDESSEEEPTVVKSHSFSVYPLNGVKLPEPEEEP